MSPEQMESLIGLKFIDSPAAPSSPTEGLLTRSQLPKNSRVIPKGYVVTMDYQEDRLNLHLDEKGIVSKVKKG